MRVQAMVTGLTAIVALTAASALAAPGQSGGYGSPACLRGEWAASAAETKRVVRSLVPVDGLEPRGKLYMVFRGGMFQYGSTNMVFKTQLGDVVATAQARFFSLQRYTARSGSFTTRRGESTIEYGKMSATKGGITYTVKGPPSKTRRVPGGTTPFQCRGNTLRVKLPRFASLDWITLRRR